MSTRAVPYGVRAGLLCVLYVATARFGLSLDAVQGFAAAVWFPTGLALGALVLGGSRLWPGIALGAFLVNVSAGAPALAAGGMAVGNTLEAVVGTVLLRRVVGFRPALDRLRDVLGLVLLTAGLSTVVSATLGVTSGWLGGVIPAAMVWKAWRTWWLGDALGALVVAPLCFVWSGGGRISLLPRRIAEAIAVLVGVSALSLAVFGPVLSPPLAGFPYILFPALIWAAVRLGPPGAVTATGLVSVIAIWGTIQGAGPFASQMLHENLLALQAFMSIVAVTILVLAAVTAERQQAETTRTQLAAIVNSSEDAIIGKTVDGRITSWNRGAERLYGYTAVDVLGQPIARLIPPDMPDELPAILARLQRGERVEPYETQRVRNDGTRLAISLAVSPIRDGAGRLIGASAIARDITAQKHLEDALRAATDHLHLVTDAMAAPVTRCSRDLRYLWVSRAYAAWLGRAPDTIVGRPICDILGPDAFASLYPYFERVLAGEVVQYEERVMFAGLGPRWVTAVYTPTVDATGQPDGWVAVVLDMTERKHTEAALQQAHAELARHVEDVQVAQERTTRILESITDAFVAFDPDWCYTYVNAEAERLLGLSRSQLLGRQVWECFPAFVGTALAQALQRAMADRTPVDLEDYNPRRGRWFEHHVSPAADGGVSVYFRDITDRRHLEAQLRQAQKMEAIGALAGGIAHDFNNLLAVILGYTELTLAELAPASAGRRRLEQVLLAGSRAKDLVQQILAFSRQTPPVWQPVQLLLIVQETLTLLRASLPSTIDLQAALAPEPCVVRADPIQMQQVLMNLATNAAYAMRETGGVLAVRLDVLALEACAAQPLGLSPGPYVRLRVRDTGCGMPAEVCARLFEPYFTTKAVGEGTGLGLAVVHGIVVSHGGAITVESLPGMGSTFTLYLPRLDAQASADPPAETVLPGGHERILFVDDEEGIARLGQEVLRPLGYTVTIRTSSVEALETFRAAPERYDLVITDQTMPQLTGEQLAAELRRLRPHLPIILCTGFSDVMNAEKAQAVGIDAFCLKPVMAHELAQAIRRVCALRGARGAGPSGAA